MRIAVVTRESTRPADAICAHAHVLTAELRRFGHQAALVMRTDRGVWRSGDGVAGELAEAISSYDLAILAYNPFLYGRRGVAPWLPREFVRARGRRSATARTALLVHEPYVRATDVRSSLHAAYLRTQLAAMRVGADVVLASTDAWARELGRWWPRRPTTHVPSGSVLPDRRSARDEIRRQLGVPESTIVVATLSSGHPSHEPGLAARAVTALVQDRDVLLLVLGAGAKRPPSLGSVPTVVSGALSADDLARQLSAVDIFLSPLDDGVSTRRTTLMAALQHGIAVVGTHGRLTDPELVASEGLILAPVQSEDAFVAAVRSLAADPERRRAVGAAARCLFEARYAPDRIATRILDACLP